MRLLRILCQCGGLFLTAAFPIASHRHYHSLWHYSKKKSARVLLRAEESSALASSLPENDEEHERSNSRSSGTTTSSSSTRGSDMDELMELYRLVAEQDPEWYQEFVCNILEGDALLEKPPENAEPDENEHQNSILKFEPYQSPNFTAKEPFESKNERKNHLEEVGDCQPIERSDSGTDDKQVANLNVDKEERTNSDADGGTKGDKVDVNIMKEETIYEVGAKNRVMMTQETNVTVDNGTEVSVANVKGPTPVDQQQQPSIVVYRDLYSGEFLAAPLKALTRLGYTSDDVAFLQPDALSLILQDEIVKPRRGVPQQWKVSPSQKKVLYDDVRIVSKEQAKEIMESLHARKSQSKHVDDREISDTKQRPRSQQESKIKSEQRRQAQSRTENEEDVDQPARPGRQRPQGQRTQQRRRVDDEERIIDPSARPSAFISNGRDGDPPTPVNPLWVDINTFRDLLRKEAELRVRILGKDWKPTVKRESQWRLDLYKEWLWSLSEGVGDPIVHSRVGARRSPTSSKSARTRNTGNADLDSLSSTAKRQPSQRKRNQASRELQRRVLDPRTKQPGSRNDTPSERQRSTRQPSDQET